MGAIATDIGPSRTSLLTAWGRGIHRLEDAPPWVLDDPFALTMIGPDWSIMAERFRQLLPAEVVRQAIAAVVARSRFAEDRLGTGKFSHYIILGAGLDSFAWRHPHLLKTLKVVEVDQVGAQTWKLKRMADIGLPKLQSHSFVPANFENLDASTVAVVGADPLSPALFSWLGVTVYLTIDAIEATLRLVARAAPGSEIALTYYPPDEHLDEAGVTFVSAFSTVAAASGEPLRTRLSPGEMESLARQCGLEVVDHPSRDEMTRRYFSDRTDGLRPGTAERVIALRTPAPSGNGS